MLLEALGSFLSAQSCASLTCDFILLYISAKRYCFSDYATPDLDFDHETEQGLPFYDDTNGDVIVELTVVCADIPMDIGRFINLAIDQGKIAGASIQETVWVARGELRYCEDGRLLSCSPPQDKIPTVRNIPETFNVDFVENLENPGNVGSSKVVREPPLQLAVSVCTAVKNALAQACPLAPDCLPRLPLLVTNGQRPNCLIEGGAV